MTEAEQIFISYPITHHADHRPVDLTPVFRRHFTVREGLQKAELTLCALGIGEAYLNGCPVTADRFIAPVSDYRKTLWTTSYDVTNILQAGENLAAMALGNGMYNESLHSAWDFEKAEWRDVPKFLFDLEMTYADGTVDTLTGDENWLCQLDDSPYIFNELRYGEKYDARKCTDWMMPDHPDGDWPHAVIAAAPAGKLRPCPAPPIREDREYACVELFRNNNGDWVFDFGQNMSGYVSMHIDQPEGTKLTVWYAEQLNADGTRRDNGLTNFYKDGVPEFSEIICSGKPFDWKPQFSYYGFRYAIISGYVTPPDIHDVRGVFVHQSVDEIGHFRCSDTMLNRLWRCARMSSLSNMFYLLSDCPTREKLGWCNDATASTEQMLQNYDMVAFFDKWMQDIRDAVLPDGDLPGIVPTGGWGYAWGSGPISTGILFEVPYRLYQYYGDTKQLVQNYAAMRLHLQFLEGKVNPETGLCAHGLSDWAGPFRVRGEVPTPLDFSCTLLLVKFYRIAAMAAGFAGDTAGVEECKAGEKKAAEAFRRNYMEPDGRCKIVEQCAVAMVIALGLYDDIAPLKAQLKESIAKHDDHLYIGMLGMQYLFPALDACGMQKEAYDLLTSKGYPSYSLWFDWDATTLFEEFSDRNSRNHHMYSCVVSWLHNTILGIKQDENLALNKTVTVAPYFAKDLDFAEGSYQTVAGEIRVAWERKEDHIDLTVCVPDGVIATVCPVTGVLENGEKSLTVSGGKHQLVINE